MTDAALQLDLFAPPAPVLPPPPPPFDPYRHPCAVCGAAHAPFGIGLAARVEILLPRTSGGTP